ncbi:aconitase X [Dinoroseobacter sp. S124A]|uniref:cis-3-hydroxy-L-proline dehydratase n=1 Tax=Dinoroseobacter sp. S124A TaxID=3415128 RepID=UPI003C7C19D0
MTAPPARMILPADLAGDILVLAEGLSFWGGVDPETGEVIDAHHPLHGQSLADRIVLMPTSRGSCSGSGVLLELALNGHAPAALVFREAEEILTLGALIAHRMFHKTIGILRLPPAAYDQLAAQPSARIAGGRLVAPGLDLPLHRASATDLALSEADRAMLDGAKGAPVALAMDVIATIATAQGATGLRNVMRGHIDGCIYAHPANLTFARAMAEMGARVAIPTTINAVSVDRAACPEPSLPPAFGAAASALADAYVEMGARPTFTCAPYLLEDVPRRGEDIGWSESNAVIFANTVLGARTAKHPDYLDLFIAMTGRAPETGVYLTEGRRPNVILEVDLPARYDDGIWPLIGWLAGRMSPEGIPLLTGLAEAAPSRDDLRAICAAFGTTSAAPMLHIAGVTPESTLPPLEDAQHLRITEADLSDAWAQLNGGPADVNLIALGSPHFSLEETRAFAALMSGGAVRAGVSVIITLGRDVYQSAMAEGLVAALEATGVRFHADLCWCSIVEPVFPPDTTVLMTNSGKYAHYAPGLSGRRVRFGSLSDCAHAAQNGHVPSDHPLWQR